jgi:hypothetical protein
VKYRKRYVDWHWGIEPETIVEWEDPDYPEYLIEAGRLAELRYREPGRRRDTAIKLGRNEMNRSHIAFDPEHPNERLYLVLAPEVQEKLAKQRKNTALPPLPLGELAAHIGGRHGDGSDYPDVEVTPMGILTAVIYYTIKEGDGPSFYIHQMGEESGVMPALGKDKKGRLWLAGGNYTSPTPGITD